MEIIIYSIYIMIETLTEVDETIKTMIVINMVIFFISYNLKHEYFYDKQGDLKQFGTGDTKTVFPLWLVVLLLNIVIYVYFISSTNDFV